MSTQEMLHTPASGTALRLLAAGDPGYDSAVTAWNPLGSHRPSVVVVAEHAEDVVAAVRHARAEGLGVGVMATGHGTAARVVDGLLINTSAMKGLSVDPVTRTAWVQAGVTWAELNARAALHGLIGLQGSHSGVGVVGYSLGGGFGWLGRRFGFASQTIVAVELVTAAGDLITASATRHPDLFWGLKGSAGNLGVVTALQVRLVEVGEVYGGALYYPPDRAPEVLGAYAAWAAMQPDAMASSVALVRFPPLPFLPAVLRGRSFTCVRVCHSGADLGPGVAAVSELRQRLGQPLLDQVERMPAVDLARISSEPTDPVPVLLHSSLLPALTTNVIERLTQLFTSDTPLAFVELRHLGGALRVPDDQLSPLNRTGATFSLNAAGLAPTPGLHAAVTARLAELADALAPFADGAAYVNFLGGDTRTAMRAAFSASEWERLVDLKDRWDPDNVFRFNRNIPPREAASSPA